jgi:hypothetical protein
MQTRRKAGLFLRRGVPAGCAGGLATPRSATMTRDFDRVIVNGPRIRVQPRVVLARPNTTTAPKLAVVVALGGNSCRSCASDLHMLHDRRFQMVLGRLFVFIVCLLAAIGGTGCQTATRREVAAMSPAAVEWTFLKAKPGKREALRDFIIRNWFAMDERAVRAGLMRSYRLLDSKTDDGPWDLAVEVEYFDGRGYEGIKERFDAIRAEHVVQPVDGNVLRDLGAVVGSRRLYPAAHGGAVR